MMRGNVFIAWGGNKGLADRVAEQLRRSGLTCQVGGDVQQGFFIGKQILEQIQKAQMAIILVQGTDESVPGIDVFRPNLMFEWGYLFARLLPENVHIFLIGISPVALPSDLQGCWCNEIVDPLDENELATRISNDFLSKIQNYMIDPGEIFSNWDLWKLEISQQIRNLDIVDEHRLASAILHGIQPSYYYNDIGWLKHTVSSIKCSTPELKEAKEVVSSICSFYLLTENQLKRPGLGELKSIKDELWLPIELENPFLCDWINLIRIDFLGLCYMFMADAQDISDERADYLDAARECFQQTIDIIDEMRRKFPTSMGYYELWQGYALRNLGNILAELDTGDERARQCYEKAYRCRVNALRFFKSDKAPDLLLTHLELETCLVMVEMFKYGYRTSRLDLKETISALRRLNKQFDLWKFVIQKLNEIGVDLEDR